MNRVFIVICTVTTLCVLFSCSVQKRRYQKGFYVSHIRHKSTEQKRSASVVRGLEKSRREVVTSASKSETKVQDVDLKRAIPLEVKEHNEQRSPAQLEFGTSKKFLMKSGLLLSVYPAISKTTFDLRKPEPKYGKIHPYSLVSLGMNVISLIVLFVCWTWFLSAPFVFGVFILYSLLLLFLAVITNIFAKKARKGIKEGRSIYRGKHLAVTCNIIGWIMLAILWGTFLSIYLWVLMWSFAW